MRHSLLVGPTLLLLTACAARAPLAPPAAPFPLSEVWRVELDPLVDGERLAGPVVGEGETVFLALENGVVRALTAATGTPLWEVKLERGVLAAAADRLILKQRDGTVVSLDPTSGRVRWRMSTDAEGDLPAAILDQRVAVAGQTLALLDGESGERIWTTGGVGPLTTVPILAGRRVLVRSAEGLLRCFDLQTGSSVWTRDVGGPADASPVADERGRVFVGASRGRILGLSLSSGNERWAWRVGSDTPQPGLVLKDTVLFVSLSAVGYALVRENGHVAWRAALPSRPLAPLVRRGGILLALVYGDRENRSTLVAFAEEGKRLGTFDITGEAVGTPLVLGERLIVSLREQAVVALAPAPRATPAPTSAAPAPPLSTISAPAPPTPPAP